MLPPGQIPRTDFPRFGLPKFTSRFPANTTDPIVELKVDEKDAQLINLSDTDLARCSTVSDFHCVTTWTHTGLEWEGIKLSDLLHKHLSKVEIDNIEGAIFYSQDGYKTTLIRDDLFSDESMIVDRLNGEPLTVEHGAPIRLIAPAHYGYKNPKYLSKIELQTTMPIVKRGLAAFLDHPRGRVAKEERSRWIPGWLLRHLYRSLIPGTVKSYKKAMQRYNDKKV